MCAPSRSPTPARCWTPSPTTHIVAWTRGTDGFAAWGEAARLTLSGPDRFARAAQWWRELVESLDVDDQVHVPGTGPVAFGSFTFDDGPSSSVMIVPNVIVGRRDGASWITTIGDADATLIPTGAGRARPARSATATATSPRPGTRWPLPPPLSASAAARSTRSSWRATSWPAPSTSSTREPSSRPLSRTYPSCWTFAIDGLIGATPELLVRRTGDHVVSRVLAGTTPRGSDAVVDAQHAADLLASDKDRVEHELAVRSVSETLGPFCSDLVVPRAPEVVRLANVQHLQTDITGRLANGESALDLAAALHPTAAVCGTPTGRARAVIRELEDMDRGRYAGPVGWIDSRGDGAFGIALRCAQIDPDDAHSLRMYAGCGIVAGSLPADELAESQTKLLAIREALEAH